MVAPRFDDLRWLDQAAIRRLRGCLICSLLSLIRYAALRVCASAQCRHLR